MKVGENAPVVAVFIDIVEGFEDGLFGFRVFVLDNG